MQQLRVGLAPCRGPRHLHVCRQVLTSAAQRHRPGRQLGRPCRDSASIVTLTSPANTSTSNTNTSSRSSSPATDVQEVLEQLQQQQQEHEQEQQQQRERQAGTPSAVTPEPPVTRPGTPTTGDAAPVLQPQLLSTTTYTSGLQLEVTLLPGGQYQVLLTALPQLDDLWLPAWQEAQQEAAAAAAAAEQAAAQPQALESTEAGVQVEQSKEQAAITAEIADIAASLSRQEGTMAAAAAEEELAAPAVQADLQKQDASSAVGADSDSSTAPEAVPVHEALPPGLSPAGLVLHWGVDSWEVPPVEVLPPGTQLHAKRAARTHFTLPANAVGVGEPGGPRPSLTLTFPEHAVPSRLVWVLHAPGADAWVREQGTDFTALLRAPTLEDVVAGVLAAEGSATHWSLLHRLQRALEVMDTAAAAGARGASFLFTWLRLSATQSLTWQRAYSYTPRDITRAQQQVAEACTALARGAGGPEVRLWARRSLARLSRGGGNGDEIRMGILHIMRDHGIAEGNRPGHDEPFLEQWHQKLHQNTTPQDVAVAEAYLAFLASGDHADWWRVLGERGLSAELLAAWEQPITALPQHLPHLIPSMQHYAWVLRTCHAGAELDTALAMCQGLVDDDLRWHLYDLAAHRDAWWAPGKVVELRHRLAPYWQAEAASRDLLLLDIALEGWLRLLVERADKRVLSTPDLVVLLGLVLDSAALTRESEELVSVAAQWRVLRGLAPLPAAPAHLTAQGASGAGGGERAAALPDPSSREWALLGLAALQRLVLALGALADDICGLCQPYAEQFADVVGMGGSHVANFGEEVVRDSPVFVASLLAAELEPRLRHAVGASAWQMVSSGMPPIHGRVVSLRDLSGVQGVSYASPVVLRVEALGGTEDIPLGVAALLSAAPVDALSHVAIRARCQGVLLAACDDAAVWTVLSGLEGREVGVEVNAQGDILLTPEEPPTEAAATATTTAVEAAVEATASSTGGLKADGQLVSSAASSILPLPAVGVTSNGNGDSNGNAYSNGNGRSSFNGTSSGKPAVAAPAKALLTSSSRTSPAPASSRSKAASGTGGAARPLPLVLREDQFAAGEVGAKARHLAALRARLPAWVLVPASVALPFTTWDTTLDAPANAAAASRLAGLTQQLEEVAAAGGGLPAELLASIRQLVVSELVPPPGLQQALCEAVTAAGLLLGPGAAPGGGSNGTSSTSASDSPAAVDTGVSGSRPGSPSATSAADAAWDATWSAICRVWASKWNDRAWLSRRAVGLAEEELRVSVLLQQVLPAQYAFVLHTAHPLSGAVGEVYGELVVGLGEALVGNHPGRPLAFWDDTCSDTPQLLTLPSKRHALWAPAAPCLIARSDTSGEDLPGYAGAGLYDSVTVLPLEEAVVDYASEPLLWDASWRGELLDGLVELGLAVEDAMGGTPQDIEGLVLHGQLAVVQARPQVLAPTPALAAAPRGTGHTSGDVVGEGVAPPQPPANDSQAPARGGLKQR